MKLEYVANANVGGSGDDIIRLFDFMPIEAKALIDAIRLVVVSHGRSIQLSECDFIEPLNCELELTLSDKDIGIRKHTPGSFTCELTRQGYLQMVGLMEPFTHEGATGHQWLYDLPSADNRIELLFSPNGKW